METENKVEEIIENEKAAEQRLKEEFNVSHIRMPGSKILASEIEEKLKDAALVFANIICAWPTKDAKNTAIALVSLSQVTSIHPSLLFAYISRIDIGPALALDKYPFRYFRQPLSIPTRPYLEEFNLEKYDKKGDENCVAASQKLQMFYILSTFDNLILLKTWSDDHIIKNSYLENDRYKNMKDDEVNQLKSFVEDVGKYFSRNLNLFIDNMHAGRKEVITYLLKLGDVYMLCTDGKRNIKDEWISILNSYQKFQLQMLYEINGNKMEQLKTQVDEENKNFDEDNSLRIPY